MEMTQIEYSAARGCSAAYVSKLKRQGRLVLTPAGKVDVEATDFWVSATSRPTMGAAASMADLQKVVMEALLAAANALAPRVAAESNLAACRALLAQELGRTARAITDAIRARCATASAKQGAAS
jgi:hypothetical protein